MGKKICCLCNRLNLSDRWLEVTDNSTDQVRHGLCPPCFAATRDKVKKIYSPASAQMQAASEMNSLPEQF